MATRYIRHIVRSGDTLQSLAVQYLGDYSRWIDIATLNSLDYPFIIRSEDEVSISFLPTSSYKKMGDEILIPIEESGIVEKIQNQSNIDQLVFGSDISLANGKMYANSAGDLEILSGHDCLKQDLSNKLKCELGSSVINPDYGVRFENLIGNKMSPHWKYLAELEVTKAFLEDERVEAVQNLDVTLSSNGAIYISCTVLTKLGSMSYKENL